MILLLTKVQKHCSLSHGCKKNGKLHYTYEIVILHFFLVSNLCILLLNYVVHG